MFLHTKYGTRILYSREESKTAHRTNKMAEWVKVFVAQVWLCKFDPWNSWWKKEPNSKNRTLDFTLSAMAHTYPHTHIHKSFLERKRLCLWKLGFHWRLFLFCFIEPNLLSGTAHSVNKRGVKRRDLDIEELREVLSSLLPFVRIEHILPINSEVLNDAVSLFLHYFQRKKNAKLILY